MSNENFYEDEYKQFQSNYYNDNSHRENQSISNALPESDLRNKIKNNLNLENIVIECQSGKGNELEGRNVKIAHKKVFKSDDVELYKENVQCDFINNKLYVKSESVLNIVDNKGKQEFTNTLKSWFNTINKDFNEVVKYEYYTILPKITVEHLAAQFLRRELIAKKFVTEQNANDKISEILNIISTNHSRVVPRNLAGPLNVEYDRDRNILSVGKFKSLKVPRDKLLSNESEIISTGKLLLREKSLGNFRGKESRFVEHSTRVNNESDLRNLSRHSNSNSKEEKRKIDSSYKYSERNDKITDEWQPQEQSTPRVNNESSSDWRRNRENSKKRKYDHNEVRLSSSSSSTFSVHRHRQVNVPNDEWQQQQPTPRVNNESSEWRNPPRYNKYGNSNKEEKWKIDYSYKYSERNNIQRKDNIGIELQQEEQFQSQSARVNNESSSEWRRNRENNNKNWNEQLRQSSSSSSSSPSSSSSSDEESQPQSEETEKKNQSSSKVILSSSDIDLYKEYVQWDFINNKLYERGESLLNIRTARGKQEFTNTLQRWFIFINEDFNEVPKYEYFTILPDIRLEHPAAQFLRDAIIEKKFANEEDADWKMRKILGFISSGHSEVVPHESADPLYVKHDPDRKIVVVNKFQSEEVPRVNLLVEKGGVIATARMLLRYESFGNGSYQWGDPQKVHRTLYKKFNVRYEGFASPVNSRFIEYNNTHFCSLFPETDAVFGSIGNFFHVDMEKHAGGWSVNPPFLNDLMKNVADRINRILDEGHKCYFFCTFPWWEDDEGWQTLNRSRHLLKRFDLPPHHFRVQDAYGNTFVPKMAMNLFVMGELPSMKKRLTVLGRILVRKSKKALPIDCPW